MKKQKLLHEKLGIEVDDKHRFFLNSAEKWATSLDSWDRCLEMACGGYTKIKEVSLFLVPEVKSFKEHKGQEKKEWNDRKPYIPVNPDKWEDKLWKQQPNGWWVVNDWGTVSVWDGEDHIHNKCDICQQAPINRDGGNKRLQGKINFRNRKQMWGDKDWEFDEIIELSFKDWGYEILDW